ncbi:hypothetical protein DSO57_1023015 [Entomophthora muscae]|uniref:Uncharacterized protein n=1 Tax=Entomophthora muscae TaxID=34485 RepID=A0ACC2TE29_9FUNG|nr:hypothetical protein DSO57_1023015 [Entomophthora muscae]
MHPYMHFNPKNYTFPTLKVLCNFGAILEFISGLLIFSLAFPVDYFEVAQNGLILWSLAMFFASFIGLCGTVAEIVFLVSCYFIFLATELVLFLCLIGYWFWFALMFSYGSSESEANVNLGIVLISGLLGWFIKLFFYKSNRGLFGSCL